MKTFTGNKTEIQQFLYKLDKDTIYDVKLEKHRNKRSLDANSYSWVLQNEIANQLRISKEEVHQNMLEAYGQRDYISMLANIDPKHYFNYFKEMGTYKQNNNTFKSYLVFKGTSKYDSKEMAIFIDGVVQEAKNLGIKTLDDYEIDAMIKEMEKRSNVII